MYEPCQVGRGGWRHQILIDEAEERAAAEEGEPVVRSELISVGREEEGVGVAQT